MSKNEFLYILKESLEAEVSQSVVDDNLVYYNNYIDQEIQKGKSEAEVLSLLGEPRLIAKTIIETSQTSNSSKTYTYSDQINRDRQDEPKGFHAAYGEQDGWDVRYGRFKINSWYGKMLLIIMFIVIVCVIGKIAIAILPIVFPIIVIFLLVSYFTGNRR